MKYEYLVIGYEDHVDFNYLEACDITLTAKDAVEALNKVKLMIDKRNYIIRKIKELDA